MPRILIIDDEIVIRKVVRRILERAGHEVIDAENGQVGIELFRQHRPDLVITDLIMQVKGGLETIAELRAEFPTVKIIAISGGSMDVGKSLTMATQRGAQGTLRKPFSVEELRRLVAEVLGDPSLPAAHSAPPA
jgi:CheY-like chemotaxis protein